MVVAADVGRFALGGDEFGDDGVFVGGELLGDGGELGFEFGVLVLCGEGLGPVEGEVEVAASVVDAADATRGGLVVLQEESGGGVEGLAENGGLRIIESLAEVL